MTTRDVLFALLGLLTAASAVLSVVSRQVVHAALWLVTALGALAGCYLVLGAEVVALVQVLVYVGAVVVLVLFALMLTRAPIGRSPDVDNPRLARAAAGVVSVVGAGLLAVLLVGVVGGSAVDVGAAGSEQARSAAQPLARSLFGSWVLPFELLSLLLLAALVAALVLSRTPDGDENRSGGPQ
ncbi:MAG TPA: NADH-quinone oxidoreductase subunit J [Actinomycetales bacterium]|nr:NADH-quinone oxidoreductase subunit J [Actinomycetales bacterium]